MTDAEDAPAPDEQPTTRQPADDEPPATEEQPAAEAPAAAARPSASRARRIVSWALIAVTSLILVFAINAVWVKRQLLDTQYWTDTSSELLQNEEIQSTVADYLVDELFANVDISGEIESALPKELKPLAGPATGGLRNVATEAANKALEDPRVQNIWVDANRVTHEQFVKLVKDEGSTLTVKGDAVILDLSPLVTNVADRAGLGSDVGAKLPAGIAQVTVIQSEDVEAVQTAVRLFEDLVLFLVILVPLLYALSIYLVPGYRIRALMAAGLGSVAAGLIVKIARGVIGDQVVSTLASTAAIEPTVQATWTIGTSLLSEIASNTILGGVLLIIAAWLGGRWRPAVALRRAAAPWLRDRPDISWGVFAAIVLLFLLIVDVPATRQPIPLLVIIGLFVLGMVLLRRETAREFPAAQGGDAVAGVRGFAAKTGESIGRGVTSARTAVASTAAKRGGGGGGADAEEVRYAKLEKLASLRDRGVLTDEEFAAQKAALLHPDQE
jgi:hypothetical protein